MESFAEIESFGKRRKAQAGGIFCAGMASRIGFVVCPNADKNNGKKTNRDTILRMNAQYAQKMPFTFTIQEKHLATPVAAHGGALAALADALIGVAALSAVAEELKLVSTIEFKIN